MAMNQIRTKQSSGQVEYLGRWVDTLHFRAYVYNDSGQKLANSYAEFQDLISSGLWFKTKEEVEVKFHVEQKKQTESTKEDFKVHRDKNSTVGK